MGRGWTRDKTLLVMLKHTLELPGERERVKFFMIEIFKE